MQYLLFRLYGPMASWGEIAVGESRHTAIKPTKSALTGLLGAALGIKREDEPAQQALATNYSFAMRVYSIGQLLRDYHTVQVPDSVGKFRYRTRRDELLIGKSRLGTVLSSREYRTNAHAVVALRIPEKARWSLEQLRQALLQPKYHLYLGRKSCPLAAPLQPELVSASTFRQVLQSYQPKPLLDGLQSWESQERWLPHDELQAYFWEGSLYDFSLADENFNPEQVQQLSQYDQPLSRSRWQFQPRMEYFWQQATGGRS